MTEMNGTLYDMIFRRKSFHIFRNVGDETITDQEIEEIKETYDLLNGFIDKKIRAAQKEFDEL